MEAIESEGKSVTEAVEAALRKLNLRRDQVEVQILQEASAGFLGMGAKPARVRITEKIWGTPSPAAPAAAIPARRPTQPRPVPAGNPAPRGGGSAAVEEAEVKPLDTKQACAETQKTLEELLGLMGFSTTMKVSWDPVQERVRCALDGADADRLTQDGGRTLESLQFLVTLMMSRKLSSPCAVQVDARGYWDKREQEIIDVALKAASEAKSTGKAVRLQPMDAPMRRLIHRNLQNHPDVETMSEGEGAWRKIVVRPRKR